ncbi:MAG: DNA-processing protein DprA, partial [Myxococcales bacterium]|nr:DNA-processing protein DprA [Myxococcales bacterium]
MHKDTSVQLSLSYNRGDAKPLTMGEIAALKTLLSASGYALGELLHERAEAWGIFATSHRKIPEEGYLRMLLAPERRQRLVEMAELWKEQGIEILGVTEDAYPSRLVARMGERAPLLYCQGSVGLLDQGGVAVVGSRTLPHDLVDYAREMGGWIAQSGLCLISGGAL